MSLEKANWDRNDTLLLIEAFKVHQHKNLKGQNLWQSLKDFLDSNGVHYTLNHVKGKWRGLLRSFKKVKCRITDNKNQQYVTKFMYLKQMEEVFDMDSKPQNNCSKVVNSLKYIDSSLLSCELKEQFQTPLSPRNIYANDKINSFVMNPIQQNHDLLPSNSFNDDNIKYMEHYIQLKEAEIKLLKQKIRQQNHYLYQNQQERKCIKKIQFNVLKELRKMNKILLSIQVSSSKQQT